ncbi:hypothetical protein JYT44_00840 [Caldithrix abyssi]|nr:hypothetical protein [Caldithrix abyssi]
MKLFNVLQFIEKNGIVLESAKSSVPNVAEFIAGKSITGSWWGHPQANEIFQITRKIRASNDILVCRFIEGKITFIHRNLWPALVRLSSQISKDCLTKLDEIHTERGQHQIIKIKYPDWVPLETRQLADKLSSKEANRLLSQYM